MTNAEAIYYLEQIKNSYTPFLPEEENALDMAISALEKQEGKKPIGTHYAHMRCPACNHRIPSGGGSSSHRRDNWCNYCGQKIDWLKQEVKDNEL